MVLKKHHIILKNEHTFANIITFLLPQYLLKTGLVYFFDKAPNKPNYTFLKPISESALKNLGEDDNLIISSSENNEVEVLKNNGVIDKNTYIHLSISGGSSLHKSLSILNDCMLANKDNKNFLIWLDPLSEEVFYNGKNFFEMSIYKLNSKRILAVIEFSIFKNEIFLRLLKKLLHEKLSFEEALKNEKFFVHTKQRIKKLQTEIFNNLDKTVNLIP